MTLTRSYQISLAITAVFMTAFGLFADTAKPNVVVFLIDDLGFDDIGGSGNPMVESPILDQLKRESMAFDQFVVAPACAPTRASFLTGRDFWRTGITHVHGGGDYLNSDEITIADVLSDNGYRTGIWGKWHSGKSPGYFPENRGFDEAYYGALYKHENAHGWHNGDFVKSDKWSPELLTDLAIDFIGEESDQPFFAFINFLAVHEPIYAPEALIQRFLDKGYSAHLATLYAMVKSVDQQIGRVLTALEKSGLDENTIIVFFSDNGPIFGNTSDLGDWPERDWNVRNQWHQFRGAKGQIWENGIRVPLYVKWADEFRGVCNLPTCVTDLFPTIVELTGSKLPQKGKPLDGKSLVPLLAQQPSSEHSERTIIGHSIWPRVGSGESVGYSPVDQQHPENYPFEMQSMYAKKGPYKLLLNPDGTDPQRGQQFFLYNWKKDPKEQTNLKDQFPEVVSALTTEMKQWYEDLWSDGGNFDRPVFRIGYKGAARSKVNAFGPSLLLGNANNSNHYLGALQSIGDGAEWNIHVDQAGSYLLEIDHMDSSFPVNLKLKLCIGDQTKEFTVGNNKTIFAGKWDLDTGSSVIRLEVVQNYIRSGISLDRIRHLTFHNTSQPRNTSPYPW